MNFPSFPPANQAWTVGALGSAQTLAWASSYYLPAVVAVPMAASTGVSVPTLYAAFSAALVVSALLGPQAGRAIDHWGGRPVLALTSLVFAAGLAALGLATGPVGLVCGWLIMGIGMGSGLYEAAFAALVRLHGTQSRSAITGITLIAGFASTVGWPLTSLLEASFGWRSACFTWAALHLLVGLPLNLSLPKASPLPESAVPTPEPAPASPADPAASPSDAAAPATAAAVAASNTVVRPAAPPSPRTGLTTALLSYVFAATWFISTAMAAHLPRVLEMAGATLAVAVAAGAMVGPAQVAARLIEFGLLRRVHPRWSAAFAALTHPLGAALLLVGNVPAAVFAILHGAGNGILTIAKGTLPLVIFGAQGYGRRQGLLTLPARMAQAASPFLFGLCLDRWGAGALWLTTMIGLSAFGALLLLPRQVGTAR